MVFFLSPKQVPRRTSGVVRWRVLVKNRFRKTRTAGVRPPRKRVRVRFNQCELDRARPTRPSPLRSETRRVGSQWADCSRVDIVSRNTAPRAQIIIPRSLSRSSAGSDGRVVRLYPRGPSGEIRIYCFVPRVPPGGRSRCAAKRRLARRTVFRTRSAGRTVESSGRRGGGGVGKNMIDRDEKSVCDLWCFFCRALVPRRRSDTRLRRLYYTRRATSGPPPSALSVVTECTTPFVSSLVNGKNPTVVYTGGSRSVARVPAVREEISRSRVEKEKTYDFFFRVVYVPTFLIRRLFVYDKI